ncbi:hypothetical protein ACS0TY_026154 [Phlomoides rotata]
MSDEESIHEIVVVMVPFPGQSHLNQLLELAALISAHAVPVHFIGSSTHNRQVKLRATSLKPDKIIFHDFPTPPIETPDPSTGADKTPMHLLPAIIAYIDLCDPIAALVQQLSTKARRIVVVFDICNTPGIQHVVAIPNVECYAFYTSPASYYFYMLWNASGKAFEVDGEINHFPSIEQLSMKMSMDFLLRDYEVSKDRVGDIYNTTRSLEGQYIDLLGREEINGKKKQWAIRSNLQKKLKNTSKVHECLEWLDKQASRSVIYVCFGSTITLSIEEAGELAMGLEQSGRKFIWVLLGADKADIFCGEASCRIELPQGFEERVVREDTGMVVREWGPQLEILAHKSVGGFMCHGGWNSCFESLGMGVPIAAWPMHSDQPFVAQFLTKVVKVGVIVREWGERGEVVKASSIKSVVERLIGSEEGDEMRKRAGEISAAINNNWVEGPGGECCQDLQSFIAHITR